MSCDTNQNSTSNLNALHLSLLGNTEDYFKSKNDGNNFNYGSLDMKNVAESLKSGIDIQTLSVADAKLDIDLGENFKVAEEDSGLDVDGKILTLTIPQINYTYNSITGLWEQPESIEITFKVKPEIGKNGDLGFGVHTNSDGTTSINASNISYTNFIDTLITKTIDTPTITINSDIVTSVSHGLYKDMLNGEPNIESMETAKTFSTGTTVILAAFIDGAINNTPISIKFDDKLNTDNIDASQIKIFQLENNQFNDLDYSGTIENNIYTYTPTSLSETGGQILIRYTEELPLDVTKDTEYTNSIFIDGVESNPVIIKIGNELPDLF
jgi:hypothetical protein